MILKLYNYMTSHAALLWGSLVGITAVLVVLVLQMSYKEDISDFLPLGTEERRSLEIFQDISGANQLVILFANDIDDADRVTEAVGLFAEKVAEKDSAGWTKDMTVQFDMESISAVQEFVYGNIPYFLTEKDYARMDSLLAVPQYIERQLAEDKNMLLFPSGGMLSQNIGRDPLNLFTPVVNRLSEQQQNSQFEIYDGYVFTTDMSRAIVTLPSPFGNSETDKNAQLLTLIEDCIADMQQQYPDIKAHVIGGPQIAVGNAKQIKQDSLIAVTLSIVLILAFLFFSFRSFKNILMMALSIGWGWLFALGGMSLFHDSVSIIVIGISSVILGIAVNYPLHLVAHLEHEPDMRKALKDISLPLLVGNITTVGAFLALVPLDATALRDLGTFASLLLVGTIAYVLIYLPHSVKPVAKKEQGILTRIAAVQLDNKHWLVAAVAVLTLVFAWFSFDVEFDTNMSNINYMTEEQRTDMDYFQRLTDKDTTATKTTLYVTSSASTIDAALDSAHAKGLDMTTHFLASKKEQAKRLQLWDNFLARHKESLTAMLAEKGAAAGFATDAFSDFHDIIGGTYAPRDFEYFAPLTSTVFAMNICHNKETGIYTIVDKLQVDKDEIEKAHERYPGSFYVESMNSALVNTLSDNFNYIGFACSFIVFFFLWASFRNFKYAVISFIPMAISWIWILGIMALLGIKFNIINIILATFIFGQGDDYTIFITEGCIYERKHGKSILTSYKQGILLSAVIMFIGIGTLIFAKHPALYSLAEITIIGMSCVVFMSWMIPPLLFKIIENFDHLLTYERKNKNNTRGCSSFGRSRL
ncbi:MAG: MMPL family transporter [Prevotella sp.]|nr:MMPL family transporter [Candidatus Prevotella equi]